MPAPIRYLLPMLLALPACVATPTYRHEAAATPDFAPIAFFTGDTVGEGALTIGMVHRRPVHVEGHGTVEPDGTLLLVQHVRDGTKPERIRTWHIRSIGGDRYAGTLSDAAGPVRLETHGNALRIAYAAKGGFAVRQWLFLQPGGQVAVNHLIVRKLGIRIAALRETIARR